MCFEDVISREKDVVVYFSVETVCSREAAIFSKAWESSGEGSSKFGGEVAGDG